MKLFGCVPGSDPFYEEGTRCGVGLGNFDGVHLGHAMLLDVLRAQCAARGIPSVVYTFENHPLNVLFPDRPTELIISNAKKAALIKEKGIDGIYFEHFDRAYAAMEAEEFVREILVKTLRAAVVVVGHNYSFAKGGAGSPEELTRLGARYGFETVVIPPVTVEGETVSSTLLRAVVRNGEAERYRLYTGRLYSIPGVVEYGRRIGRTLGFPTANILPRDGFALPRSGVYITRTRIGGRLHDGITNIGSNPTFGKNRTTVETHLLDYHENLYGQSIEVFFIRKIRDEILFRSPEELSERVHRDIETAKRYFAEEDGKEPAD